MTFYQPAAREARGQVVLCLCIPTYYVCNNYITYIVSMSELFRSTFERSN